MAPPKKKRKIGNRNPNAKPGIARAHLEEHFSAIPESREDLKKGHVLYLFTTLGKSRADTERRLSLHYSFKRFFCLFVYFNSDGPS